MIKLTSKAIEAIADVLLTDPEVTGKHLRVAVRGGGCSGYEYVLDFDDPDEDDQIINYPGVNVCIDPHTAGLLVGTVVDYISDSFKAGFTFINPNARTTCGCGQSWGGLTRRGNGNF